MTNEYEVSELKAVKSRAIVLEIAALTYTGVQRPFHTAGLGAM